MIARHQADLRALLLGVGLMLLSAAAHGRGVAPADLGGLSWRGIGPAVMSGRVAAVAGVPGDPHVVVAGHSTAGLYLSEDRGVTFRSVFNHGGTLSIGAVALDPRNPQVIYIGTGEGNPRVDASVGDGIYKSLDDGRTWQHLGLEKSQRITRILVDPDDPRVILVAALGDEWGPGSVRGVYRSADGGNSWRRVLYVNDTTGASDLAFDPRNPNVIYAGMFDLLRKPWHLRDGGPGSGLWRSEDNGVTWQKLTDPALANGLPAGPIARVGVAVAPSDPNVVYAMLPSKEGVLWRSDDGGDHWHLVDKDKDHEIDERPWYFSQLVVDPADADRVYALSGEFLVSIDGGRRWRPIKAGGDNHALWIDPDNPRRMILGSDMGLNISYDHGATWDYLNNMPWGQAYHVGYDLAQPYHVMGGFQDHEVWWGPSTLWRANGAQNGDWVHISPWGDGQYAMADPDDPNIVYFDNHYGDLTRLDMRSGVARYITPYPVSEFGSGVGRFRYRFGWDDPFLISHFDHKVIYFGGNVLFRTRDGGQTWQVISPDLTRDDPQKLQSSGGPIDSDNSNAESYDTISAISEDAADPAVIWVGTDDGNVQISRDGGAHWSNVAGHIGGLPSGSPVSSLRASPSVPGRAYVAFDRHQLDDFAPYVYVTENYGRSWKPIAKGLSAYVHVVGEDPKQPGLVYAGTDSGPYASLDGGKQWVDLRLGLPRLPVYDLAVQPVANDLIIATHARGYYILDDVTPLQSLAAATSGHSVRLFQPVPATEYVPMPDMPTHGQRAFVAPNRPYGAILSFYLPPQTAKTSGQVSIRIRDSSGKTVRHLQSKGRAGINRVVWNLREDSPLRPQAPAGHDDEPRKPTMSAQVLPGTYSVDLTAAGEAASTHVIVRADPHWKLSPQELAAHHQAVDHLGRMWAQARSAAKRAEKMSGQIAALEKRLSDPRLRQQGESLRQQLDAIHGALGGTKQAFSDLTSPVALTGQIGYLFHLVDGYPGAPTAAQSQEIGQRETELAGIQSRLDQALNVKLQEFNSQLRSAGVPVVGTAAP